MVGRRTDQQKLNHTLEKVCDILTENNLNDWFIAFGTLLGIVRDDNCIQGDDDLDIMINCDYQHLKSLFEKEGFDFMEDAFNLKDTDKMLKSFDTEEFTSIDFYMADVEGKNYFTPWQNVEFQNVEIETKAWKSTHINLPKNAETMLEKLYGGTWRTPVKTRKKDSLYDRSLKNII
jgi:phosphorylcholine metabolism protein LicD